jgi:hypothetical protein
MNSMLFPASTGTITLAIAPHAGISLVDEVIAHLALSNSVRVFDCGNRTNVFPIAKIIRSLTTDVDNALAAIQVSRAFTCYQVTAMLHQEPALKGTPIIVVDLLSTFLDEDVSLTESHRLLAQSISSLQRLCKTSPVLITINPLLSLSAERISLLNALAQIAQITYRFEETVPVLPQQQEMLWPPEI